MTGPAENQARREALSDAKRALLEQRLRGEPTRLPEPPTRGGEAPATVLSSGQERLWFLQQLAPQGSAYNMSQAFRLRGRLDVELLERSLHSVVQRHEILRTVYPARDGRPFAAPCPRPVALRALDFSALPAGQREQEARNHADAQARLPFDLAQGPLIRAFLLRLSRDEHVLVVVLHHIICDEWSLDLFWREVAAFYSAGGEVAPDLARPAIPYSVYAAQQRSQLETARSAGALEYWRSKLAGPLPKLALPYDRARASRQARPGALVTSSLSALLAASIADFARARSVTPFVVSLAAFKALLHRYTGETDVIVGAPFTGRSQRDLESVFGFFINSVVLRTDLSGDPSFAELVQRVRTTVLEALAHQELPFERLVDALRPDREVDQNPLFQVMLVPQRDAGPPRFSPALRAEPFLVQNGGAKLDLTLFMAEPRDGLLQAAVEYDTDLFDRVTAERMLLHLGVLLEAALGAPDTAVGTLPLASESELDLLREWEVGAPVIPPASTVHEWIARQAQASPAAVAVVSDDGELTYGELRARAGLLARRLRALGAGPNVCVGLCAERSADMIVGMLGILEAGAAYVPIDPAYPDRRLAFTLADTRAPILLVQRRLAGRFAQSAPHVIVIDDGYEDTGGAEPQSSMDETYGGAGSTTSHLAYVIHTSGSTGQPKGVRVTHSNLLYNTAARLAYYAEPPARFLLLSSFGFDSAAAGIFWTLCTGGTLVLPPARVEQDVHDLARRIEREGVTHTLLLPSLYALLLEHAPAGAMASLRSVIVAGEVCPTSLAKTHHATLPLTALYNEYGPTEATVWSTVHRVEPGDTSGRVPIGRPIPGARVHVLDAKLQRAPIGVAGELFIGGGGVAAGYVDRPAETASRFIADPFRREAGARLYRTGDRVRWTAAGVLEFFGRADEQVKLRGYRIEPAEVKAVLDQHPGVLESAVTVRGQSARTTLHEVVHALAALEPSEAEALLCEIEQGTDNQP